jgi:putative intracellular protease/amidase
MKHITIAAPDAQGNLSSVACIVGSYEILSEANAHWKRTTNKAGYKIEIAGVSKTATFSNGLLRIKPHISIAAVKKTDLIIIPSLVRDYQTALKGNKTLVTWIAQQYKNGAEVATMCTGAFMLAAAGLLIGVKSIQLVQGAVERLFGLTAGRMAVHVIAVLTAFGIYLGRVKRWNSWDVVEEPHAFVHALQQVPSQPGRVLLALSATVVFAICFSFAYRVLAGPSAGPAGAPRRAEQ